MQDHIRLQSHDGKTASAPLLAFIRKELMHGIWELILDDEFVAAYEHGIIVRCSDGVLRRMYFRIYTYSADYPEK